LKRPYAVAYRAAHDITVAFSPDFAGGGVGEVASKKEGDLQISYFKATTSGSSGDTDLTLTKYGKMLLSLTKGNIVSMGVTGTMLW